MPLLLALGMVLGVQSVVQAADDPAPVTYVGSSYAGLSSTSPTADKPQSKLFYAFGTWWSDMLASDGTFRIHELMPDHTWRPTVGVVDNRSNSTGDVLWDGSKLYVATRQASTPLRVTRLSFDPTARSWTPDAGFPITVPTGGGSESASIDKDSLGRLWVTWTRGNTVWVAHTTTDDSTFGAPFKPQVADTAISSDDLSGLVAFRGKIGVMWSDQDTGAFRFAVHRDTDPDSQWSFESALSGPSIADDHLNLKNVNDDNRGRVYAIVKTSLNDTASPSPTDPLIILVVRDTDGTWSQHTVATVADDWSRPMVQIDTVNQRALVFGTAPVTDGTIYYKASGLDDLTFPSGRGTPFVTYKWRYLNNATGTKQPLTQQSGVVVQAASGGNDSRYYHAEMPLNPPSVDAPPSAPGAPTASSVTSSKVDLSWAASSDDVGVASYTVLRDGSPVGTSTSTSYSDSTVSASTTYSYAVVAKDTSGQSSPQSPSTSVTTPAAPPASSVGYVAGASGAATGTSVSVATPAVVAGQVTVLSLAARGRPAMTAPAGWSLVRVDDNSTTMRQWAYVKVATAGAPAGTATFKLSSAQSSAWTTAVYRGVSTSQPIASSAASVNASSNRPALPAATGSPGSVAVGFVGIANAVSVTPAAGWTERGESSTPTATYKVTGELADVAIPASGQVGATTVSSSSSGASIGHTLVLTPAP